MGRVRKDQAFDNSFKYVLVGHNTIKGAAGASILNAELINKQNFSFINLFFLFLLFFYVTIFNSFFYFYLIFRECFVKPWFNELIKLLNCFFLLKIVSFNVVWLFFF